jgi:hypothetical protein
VANSFLVGRSLVIALGGLDGGKFQYDRAFDRWTFQRFVAAVNRQRVQGMADRGGPRLFTLALIFVAIADPFAGENDESRHRFSSQSTFAGKASNR